MRLSRYLLRPGCFLLLALTFIVAQTPSVANPLTPDRDGVYEVAASELKRLPSSPSVEFPDQVSTYELADRVTVALSITAEGKVKKAKAVTGQSPALRDAAERTLKKWAFEPYLVNGVAVPVRTEILLNFNNSFDNYRDPKGNIPVRLDEQTARALLIKSAQPSYPADARLGRIQGNVELRAIVGDDGRILELHIIKGHPMLAPAAYNAVRSWQFSPYLEGGKAVPFDTHLTITFAQ